MAHSILDKLEYENLTGNTLEESEVDRYHAVTDVAVAELEVMLGWPLVPDSWDNQYIEIGKSQDEWSCPDADSDDLDPPDAVVGAYRLFTSHKGDIYLNIDPAEEIHAIKLVKNGVTCKTYEADEFRAKFENGSVPITKYIEFLIPVSLCGCRVVDDLMEIAVDADWAYSAGIPTDLKYILADMVAESLDPKRDIRSESVISHSYTKFERVPLLEKYKTVLRRYAGPHGTAKRRLT